MKEPKFYRFIRPIINGWFRFTFRPTYIGLENIPKEKNYVIAGNHTNILDCCLLLSTNKRVIHFLAKEELTHGILGPAFKALGIIPVNRKIHDKDALKDAKDVLRDEKIIGIFPEGTINRTKDTILPFKIGAVKMAKDTNSKIIPCVITGKYKVFRKSITIEFLKPIENLSDDLTKENEKLMKLISDKLEEKRA